MSGSFKVKNMEEKNIGFMMCQYNYHSALVCKLQTEAVLITGIRRTEEKEKDVNYR